MLQIFNDFSDWISERPVVGMILIMLAFSISITMMVPTSLFMLTIGLESYNLMGGLLGFLMGTLMVYVASVIGSTLAFIFSKYLLKKIILSSIKPSWIKTRAVLRALEHKGTRLVILLRLAPIFPFSFLNYCLGATNVSLLSYTYGSVGMLPKQALYVYISISVGSLSAAVHREESNTTELIIILSFGTVFALAATIYLTILAKREMVKIIQEIQPMLEESVQDIE
jgi:uncharacterized membrane protein YdjX (TVP38/TMEM64 family)